MRKRKKPGFQSLFGIPLAFEISVGAVVFRRSANDGIEYLLLRYPHGHWDYAKGHIEAGETHEETLRREVREESGIELLRILPKFRQHVRYFYTAKGTELEKRRRAGNGIWIVKIVYFYLAEADGAEVNISDEHIDFAWLPFEQAAEKLSFPAARNILAKADGFLKAKSVFL